MKKTVLILIAAFLSLSLFACAQKENGDDVPDVPDVNDTGAENPDQEDTDADFEPDLTESDTRLVWTIGSLTYVFEHDGENITKTELYTDCDTPETAKKTAEALKAKHDGDGTVESIEAKGKYVHSVYAKGYMPYKTVGEVKTLIEASEKNQ